MPMFRGPRREPHEMKTHQANSESWWRLVFSWPAYRHPDPWKSALPSARADATVRQVGPSRCSDTHHELLAPSRSLMAHFNFYYHKCTKNRSWARQDNETKIVRRETRFSITNLNKKNEECIRATWSRRFRRTHCVVTSMRSVIRLMKILVGLRLGYWASIFLS